MAINNLRLCIPSIASLSWIGGIVYINNCFANLIQLPPHKRPRLIFWLRKEHLDALELYVTALSLADEVCFDAPFELPGGADTTRFHVLPSDACLFQYADIIFPAMYIKDPDTPCATWIPDFQHHHLPRFFSETELHMRNFNYGRIAQHSKLTIFSSRDALHDFKTFYPDSTTRCEVLNFHTRPEDSWFSGAPESVVAKYQLDKPFIICCNQFWAHKNHLTLFKALAEANMPDLDLVCTGATDDYRAPNYFNEVKTQISTLGIEKQVKILGVIPRVEQVQLIRAAKALIQPSLFEGWSTVVEDAKALGVNLLLSDLAVHREQNPENTVYFPPLNASALSQLLKRHIDRLSPAYSSAREIRAAEINKENNLKFALTLVNIVRIAADVHKVPL